MENRRQISHAEKLQIIYIAASPARKCSVYAYSLSAVYFLPKSNMEKGDKRVTLQWRNVTNTTSAMRSR